MFECICDNGGDVRGLDSALCGVFLVVSADVGVVEGVAGGVSVHCKGVRGLLLLPVVNHGVDGIDQAVLGNRVEEAHQVVIGGVQGDVRGGICEVAVEVVPELWDGQLSWMLRVEVLEDNVEGTAGDT